MDSPPEYLKVLEVADILRIARSRAYELVANGTILAVRIGRSVRVPRRKLTAEKNEREALKSIFEDVDHLGGGR